MIFSTFPKPDLGHADTTSITVRVCRASCNAMNPGSSAFWRSEIPDPVRPDADAVRARFQGVRQRTDLNRS
jgi:hypothetical protein